MHDNDKRQAKFELMVTELCPCLLELEYIKLQKKKIKLREPMGLSFSSTVYTPFNRKGQIKHATHPKDRMNS